MVKLICFVLLTLLWNFSSVSQQSFSSESLLRATATFSIGSPLSSASSHAYLKGELEYFLSEKWSIRGDTYLKVGELATKQEFLGYHSIFSGLSYHQLFPPSRLDLYCGLQPGINISTTKTPIDAMTFAKRQSVDPIISLLAGCTLYATHYFHAFANVRYIQGFRGSTHPPYNLAELRFSFGLGFHVGTRKKH